MPVAVVPAVERNRVSGRNLSHDDCDGGVSGSKKKMEVVGKKRPSVAGRPGCHQGPGQTRDEIIFVGILSEDVPPFDTATDDMMQGSGSLDSGFSRHADTHSMVASKNEALKQDRPHAFPGIG